MRQRQDINLMDEYIEKQNKKRNWRPLIDILLHAINSILTYYLTSN